MNQKTPSYQNPTNFVYKHVIDSKNVQRYDKQGKIKKMSS
jgi:hypothetical protein